MVGKKRLESSKYMDPKVTTATRSRLDTLVHLLPVSRHRGLEHTGVIASQAAAFSPPGCHSLCYRGNWLFESGEAEKNSSL